ncbi:EVE domain-containing protein [Tropicimonas sp. S265A]|uniref:EVE domain-containing protein n=1 Tax=Tropicimonas sp. S265A TaxID=3415134 RepID=UPI003C7A44D0
MPRYWIGVAERDYVHAAVRHGLCLFSGGKEAPIRKVSPGDGVIYYSPHEARRGEPLECFTALGTVGEGDAWKKEWDGIGFTSWVRSCDYASVTETPVRPLLSRLGFVAEPRHWGRTFQRGQLEIGALDFQEIAQRMCQNG